MEVELRTEHPHVVRVPGVCGGSAVIRGTRVPVWILAEYVQAGWTPQDLLAQFPHLSPAQIYDALSYWHDHAEEVAEEARRGSSPP